MPGNNLLFHGTTGPGGVEGNSQPDPADWLGRARASEVLHEIQSTLTSSQVSSNRNFIVDTARIGDGAQAHQLKWIAMQTGVAAPDAARVMSFDTTTGVFKLDRPFTQNALTGDTYAIFDRNNVWPDVTEAQTESGDERFRCICFRQTHGNPFTNTRIFFRILEAGPLDVARLHQATQNTLIFLQRDDDTTDILNSIGQRDPLGGPDNFIGSGGWQTPLAVGTADTNISTITNGGRIAIWLRRLIPAGVRKRTSVAVQIIAESDITTSDPNPLVGSAIMAYDILGGTPQLTIERDRYQHIGGGARLTGRALGPGGAAIIGRPLLWGVKPGDLGTIETADDPAPDYDTTDADGEVDATFFSPTLQSEAGTITTPQLTIGDGDEVGDPS